MRPHRQPQRAARLIALAIIFALASVGCDKTAPQAARGAADATPSASADAPLSAQGASGAPTGASASIYDIPLTTIEQRPTSLAEHKGKVLLIVNVASECGYTRQYPGLQALWEAHREAGLVVLGFPANNFGGQEPGSDEEIAAFCTGKFNVDFPMYAKISVKGADQHPLYQRLTGETGEQVSWNFNKFLVGRDGTIIQRFDSKVEPDSEALLNAIKAQL